MRQHGLHTTASRLKPVKPQQRIEPDQLGAGAVKTVDLETQVSVFVTIQAVGDHQHDGPLPQNAA